MVFDVWGVLQVPNQSPRPKRFQSETLSVIYATVARMMIRHTFSRIRCTQREWGATGRVTQAAGGGGAAALGGCGDAALALTFKP